MFGVQDGGWCASGPRAQFTYAKYGRSNKCRNGKGGPWANSVYRLIGKKPKWTKITEICKRLLSMYFTVSGADEQELATLILSLCHGIFTDWSIFSTPFLLWTKGSSGAVTQWRQLVSCDWLWHSHRSLIQSRFDLKINRSMKMPWQKVVLHGPAHMHRLLATPISALRHQKYCCQLHWFCHPVLEFNKLSAAQTKCPKFFAKLRRDEQVFKSFHPAIPTFLLVFWGQNLLLRVSFSAFHVTKVGTSGSQLTSLCVITWALIPFFLV